MLRCAFERPGATNSFAELPHSLHIGATDQDARTHVLFGDPDSHDVPISRAIQASMSIHPAFGATLIRGRYYVDGGVTRTSNVTEAIRRGADLVFLLDPFVPTVSKQPGYTRQRGILYNLDQDLRTVSYTRFENNRNLLLRHYPHVASYTFVPSNSSRRIMSVNPMDHRPYLEIWRGAYLSTLQRLQALRYRLVGDLEGHGIVLDTTRAEEVAARLRATARLTLADFFPDGRVVFAPPPRARAPAAPTGPSDPPARVPPAIRTASPPSPVRMGQSGR
jgi:hypothetical protein